MHIAMNPVELASCLHVMLATVVVRKVNPLMIHHSKGCVHKWQKIARKHGAAYIVGRWHGHVQKNIVQEVD